MSGLRVENYDYKLEITEVDLAYHKELKIKCLGMI
jgi:hypothetical protein